MKKQLLLWPRIFLFVLLGLFTQTVCSQAIPLLGSSSAAVWSKSEEISLGKAMYDRLYRQGRILNEQADQDYLSYLGSKIATYTQTRTGLMFYLTNAKSINAFATPGGYIGVNAGLVLATENEHELAAVLAHEIAHISQEHIARGILATKDRQLANTAALLAGMLIATQVDGQAGSGILSAVIANETQQQLNAIRAHEKEADRLGRQLMIKAGFNELAMQTFFQKLYTPTQAMGTPAYLLTHPLPINRQADIDNLKKRSKKLKSSDEYYLFRARLRARILDQVSISRLIQQDNRHAKEAVRGAADYLQALVYQRQGRFEKALQLLAQLPATMRQSRDVRLLVAKLYLLSASPQKAEAHYQKLWKTYQGDSVVAYDYAYFLTQHGDYQQAEKLLSKQIQGHLSNPKLSWLYGQVLGKQGKRNQQNELLIRYYEQIGDYHKALAQVQIALQQVGEDWYSRSLFEAKKNSLERQIEQLSH